MDCHDWSKWMAVLRIGGHEVVPEGVVVAGDHGVALELAHDGAGVDVVDARHAAPLGNDPEADPVALLAGVGAVAGPVQVQDHAVGPRPLGHRLQAV